MNKRRAQRESVLAQMRELVKQYPVPVIMTHQYPNPGYRPPPERDLSRPDIIFIDYPDTLRSYGDDEE